MLIIIQSHFTVSELEYQVYTVKVCLSTGLKSRALQWSGNPYGNGYGVEMDGNEAQFVKILWIELDLGQTVDFKRYDKYRTFTKHGISNREAGLYPKNTAVIEKHVPKLKD